MECPADGVVDVVAGGGASGVHSDQDESEGALPWQTQVGWIIRPVFVPVHITNNWNIRLCETEK